MPNGNTLRFYGTTGPGGSDGDAQTDRTLWLGRHRSSTRAEDYHSTLTASQTARDQHIIVDSSRIGDGDDAHVFSWVIMLTGAAAGTAARVMKFTDASGSFLLDRRLGGVAASGDFYALFSPGGVFPDLTQDQSRAGEEGRFRCLVMRNETGGAITDVRLHFLPLEGITYGELAIFAMTDGEAAGPFKLITDEFDDPLTDLGGLLSTEQFENASGWITPTDRTLTLFNTASLPNNEFLAFFLRRVSPTQRRARESVAYAILVTSSTTGQDPDPLLGGMVVTYDVAGIELTNTLESDRFVHILGGARYEVISQDSAGDAVADVFVRFEAFGGGSIATEDDPTTNHDRTDARGEANATYTAPTDLAEVGEPAFIRAIIGGGTEVGCPQPIPTVNFTVTVDLDVEMPVSIPTASLVAPHRMHMGV